MFGHEINFTINIWEQSIDNRNDKWFLIKISEIFKIIVNH